MTKLFMLRNTIVLLLLYPRSGKAILAIWISLIWIPSKLELIGGNVATNFHPMKAKALYEKLPIAFSMASEILTKSKLDDEKRLNEILAMTKSRLQMKFLSSGHSVAALRALSYTSPLSKLKDLTSGIGYYEVVKHVEEQFEEEKGKLIEKLQKLSKQIRLKRR